MRSWVWWAIVGGMNGALAAPQPLDPADLDRSVKPSEDFYAYANGAWLAKNPVPPAYSRWGSTEILEEANSKALRRLLDRAAADRTAPAGGATQKVGDFYASGLDEARIEADGLGPLAPEFARLDAIADRRGLARELAHALEIGTGAGFYLGSEQDAKNSGEVIAGLFQGGLGLPERDDYFKDDAETVALRAAYLEFVRRMFVLRGEPPAPAAAHAQAVLALETKLARASLRPAELRDPDAIYHRMPLADLRALMPGFPWDDVLGEIGLPEPGDFNVAQPAFFREFGTLFARVPLEDWKAYLRWHLLASVAPYVSRPFEAEAFDFYGRRLSGEKEMKPRWRRVLGAVESSLGEAVGELYVRENFPPEAKARALALVERLRRALREKIQTLAWMSAATRRAALQKLDAMRVKIGYPDRWRDYGALEITRDSYVGNALRANAFEFHRDLAKIGRPVDRGEWQMPPMMVNAYYDPALNEIVFPAGILQPPFFDPAADDAVNYGAIGATIGHEMTHGFDDQGRKFDADGNLRDWWAPADLKNFRARAAAIVEQFNGYPAVGELRVNGDFTQGENIADLGGLKIALAALEASLAGRPAPAKIDGLDWRQRFFLAYAQSWRTNARDEERRLDVRIDPHAPERFRVNGPLSNLPEFADAFDCPPGSAMRRAPAKRVDIW